LKRALAALIMLVPAPARAQFLANSPGVLTKGHQDLDNDQGCAKCHVIGSGVTNAKCADCHKPIAKSGLHTSFEGKACTSCHTDHKGKGASITNWDTVGGRNNFDHSMTTFDLAGVHEKVACTKCHLRKLKSGRTSFLGLDRTCAGCHGNTHQFTSQDMIGKCTTCHGEGGRRLEMPASELFFDHGERAGLALAGAHAKAKCGDCHRAGNMAKRGKTACAGCHQKDSPHGRAFAASSCDKCHAVEGFEKPSFSHEKTELPLRGKHATKNCTKCHESAKKAPVPECQGCHADPHRERFVRIECSACHALGGITKIQGLDHLSFSDFALAGKHAGTSCKDCHRGKGPTNFERFDDGQACRNCHAHAKAHDGQFADKECTGCHAEGGSKKLDFDHQKDTRFPLTGLHSKVECKKCHEGGKYETNKLACADCHQDSHEGQLGSDCSRCHATDVKFDAIQFDHDRISKFELVGLHEKVECEKCHPKRRYKTGDTKCASCHADDDPHQARLGMDCAKCHVPEKGAPRFVHEEMTAFALTGKHEAAKCQLCHQKPKETPPPVGWAKDLEVGKLDLAFPKMGAACRDCHFDVHAGSNGSACESCHDTASFAAAKAIHDTGAFRLGGRHDQVACLTCHSENKKLAGLGAQCFACHQKDDVHNNNLGFECGDCHRQLEWTPARFNHATVGYVLRGVHRGALCRDCHTIGVYAGTPRECMACHVTEAMFVPDPRHDGSMTECETCHTEATFAPARVQHTWYPLIGIHKTVRCSSCHQATYAGTPDQCFACHEVDYLSPSNEPNHVAMALSTECSDCHTQVTWTGAKLPPP
jgi:hypothetical protein